MSSLEFLTLLRDFFACITWFVALVYFLSGSQDLVYDIGAYWLRFWRLFTYRQQPRLSLSRLRARHQQRIAVMVPAWNEGEVVASMVDNIIKRVEYENYNIFVGTYPNDAATQNCVDRLAKEFPQIIKVVTQRPGPTTKADCLHNVLNALRAHEETNGINFDIILMHDAEDWVHPQSFLLHNYLIPQVDVVQLPILPLPTKWNKWVHWIYADEFSENHMKDVPVREKISGFVPYAGTGTGFSRKVIDFLADEHGHVFNEHSMTEDYSMSKKIREAGLKSVFVTVVLSDDNSPWWRPLCKRPMFISNWSYFPMDWTRSVRQKARWIIGISLQEWEQSGWEGNWLMKENFVKDRKVFVAASASFLGYFIFLYFMVYAMGQAGWIPFKLHNILIPGSALTHIVSFCSFFMIVRVTQRITWVGLTYGFVAGILSVPRLIVGNVLNGLATFRALKQFADSRRGKAAVRWDNTQHLEGVGDMGGEEQSRDKLKKQEVPLEQVLAGLISPNSEEVIRALHFIPAEANALEKAEVVAYMRSLASSENLGIRAALAQALGRVPWDELTPTLFLALNDDDVIVRFNAALSLLERPRLGALLEQAFTTAKPNALHTLIRVIEQDQRKQRRIFQMIGAEQLTVTRTAIIVESPILRKRFTAFLASHPIDQHFNSAPAVPEATHVGIQRH